MKNFYQASWIGKSGARVYGDIEERRDKAQMQAPSREGVALEIAMTQAESLSALKRSSACVGSAKTFYPPTPRGQR